MMLSKIAIFTFLSFDSSFSLPIRYDDLPMYTLTSLVFSYDGGESVIHLDPLLLGAAGSGLVIYLETILLELGDIFLGVPTLFPFEEWLDSEDGGVSMEDWRRYLLAIEVPVFRDDDRETEVSLRVVVGSL